MEQREAWTQDKLKVRYVILYDNKLLEILNLVKEIIAIENCGRICVL